jgi:hypothetical protein
MALKFGIFNRVIWDSIFGYADPTVWSVCHRLNKNFNAFLSEKVQREKEGIIILAEKRLGWHLWKLYSNTALEEKIRYLARYGLVSLVHALGATKKNEILSGACLGGHLELAEWVIEMGIEELETRDWDWALKWACEGGHLRVAKWTVEMGARNWDWTLRWACVGGHLEVAKWLVEIGATDLDWALRWACNGRHPAVVKWAIELGATKCGGCKKSIESHL